MPGRARFAVTYDEVLRLPVRLRDAMLEQITRWRADEDAKAAKK